VLQHTQLVILRNTYIIESEWSRPQLARLSASVLGDRRGAVPCSAPPSASAAPSAGSAPGGASAAAGAMRAFLALVCVPGRAPHSAELLRLVSTHVSGMFILWCCSQRACIAPVEAAGGGHPPGPQAQASVGICASTCEPWNAADSPARSSESDMVPGAGGLGCAPFLATLAAAGGSRARSAARLAPPDAAAAPLHRLALLPDRAHTSVGADRTKALSARAQNVYKVAAW